MSDAHAIPMLNLSRLHAPLKEGLRAAFDAALDTGVFIGGEAVAAFESALAVYCETEGAVGTSSGTDGLLAALLALGVGPGDEVITTGYSFFATAGSILRSGARPVFVDIDPATFNLDVAAIAGAVSPRTVGIVPVHLFGQCAEMGPILELAATRGLFVVEDAAQSIGARYRDRAAGSMGRAGVLSFFPAKNLGALGDGGAVLVKDAGLEGRIRRLAQHGAEARYIHTAVGGNFRLDALQAAFLTVKLPHLPAWTAGRRRVAAAYRARLSGLSGLTLPETGPDREHVFNQFVLRSPLRDALRDALEQGGIGCAVYYPVPLHLQPCFAQLRIGPGDLPECEAAAKEALAIPVDPLLTDVEVDRICDVIETVVLDRGRDEVLG